MTSICKHLLPIITAATTIALAGCAGSSAPPVTVTPIVPTSGSTSATVYTIQNYNTSTPGDQILKFSPGASGSTTPTAILTTNLYIYAVALDSSGQIYVAGASSSGAGLVNVYAAGASGAATATKTINLPSIPFAIATDVSGSIYIADQSSEVLVYPSSATGVAAPTRTIVGTSTTIGSPQSIAVDSAGTIYLSSFSSAGVGSILEFTSTANGNVAPAITLTAPTGVAFLGVAVDAGRNIYATTDTVSGANVSTVVEFAAGSTSTSSPLAVITGPSTALSSGSSLAGGLSLDSAKNIYLPLQTVSGSGYGYSILEFSAGSNGNVAPLVRFSSSSWTNAGELIAVQ